MSYQSLYKHSVSTGYELGVSGYELGVSGYELGVSGWYLSYQLFYAIKTQLKAPHLRV